MHTKLPLKASFSCFFFFYVSFTKEATFYPKQTLINSTSNKENLIWNIVGAPSGISERIREYLARKSIRASSWSVKRKKFNFFKNPSIRCKELRIEKYQSNIYMLQMYYLSFLSGRFSTRSCSFVYEKKLHRAASGAIVFPLWYHCPK